MLLLVTCPLICSATVISWPEADSIEFESQSRNGFFPSDNARQDRFGFAVHYYDSTLIVSSMNVIPRGYTGEVYVFNDTDNDGTFNPSDFQKLHAFDETRSAFFGNSITHSGNTLLISAPSANVGSKQYAGAVYQIIDDDSDRDFAEEPMTKIVNSSGGQQFDDFGESIAATEDTLVIGDPEHQGTGTVFIIKDVDGDGDFSNNIQQKIVPDTDVGGIKFGNAVAIDGNTVVVGAAGSYNGPGSYAGAVYILVDKNDDGEFRNDPKQIIPAPASEFNDQFGISVAISDNVIVVGAFGFSNPDKGAGYVIVDTDRDGDFTEEQLVRVGPVGATEFGKHVNIVGSRLYLSSYSRVYTIEDRDQDGDYAEEDVIFMSRPRGSISSFARRHSAANNQLVAGYSPLEGADEFSGVIYVWDKVGQFNVTMDENTTDVSTIEAIASDQQELTYTLVSEEDHLLFSVDAETGRLAFKSAPDFEMPNARASSGEYRVKIKASNDDGYSYAEVSILVEDLNEAPTVVTEPANAEHNEDDLLDLILSQDTFSDEDAEDSLTFSATLLNDSPLPQWLSFDAQNLSFSGTPSNDEVGTITVKISATDLANNTANAQFNLTVINTNDTPSALDDEASITAGNNLIINVLVNDSDEDGDELTVTEATAQQGSVQIVNNGQSLSYTPNASFSGTATLNYTVSDNNGGTAQAEVIVTVSAAPSSPSVPVSDSGSSGGGSAGMWLLMWITGLLFAAQTKQRVRKEQ